jgi:branched-chain amino acid transport system substrate-binding protein
MFALLRYIAFCLPLLVFVLAPAACSKRADAPASIAVIAPLTGPAAIYGEWAKNGIDLARSMGLSGVQFELHDSTGNPRTAVTIANKVMANENLLAIWTVSSGDTVAVREIAQSRDIPVITATASSPSITDSGPGVFRTIVNARQETDALIDVYWRTSQPKTAAIFYINDAGGVASRDEFKRLLGVRGSRVVSETPFEKTPGELRTLVQKALAARPEVMVVTGYSAAMGLVIKSIRELSNIPIICNQGLDSPENLTLPPSILTGIHYSLADMQDLQSNPTFIQAFEGRYGRKPGIYEVAAFDTANMLGHAVSTTSKGRRLSAVLAQLKYDGVNGSYQFTKKGNVIKHVAVYRIVDGQIERVGRSLPGSD